MTVLTGAIQTDLPTFARPALPPDAARAQTDFASILGIADRGVHGAPADAAAQAREAAEQFVAKVFIEPALAISRESSDLPPPFGASNGEKQFASLMDAQRAMDMVRSSDWPIVERLVSDMTRGAEGRVGDAESVNQWASEDPLRPGFARPPPPQARGREQMYPLRPRLTAGPPPPQARGREQVHPLRPAFGGPPPASVTGEERDARLSRS